MGRRIGPDLVWFGVVFGAWFFALVGLGTYAVIVGAR
jgi:hypothetical protein